jgi:hypothetical protein
VHSAAQDTAPLALVKALPCGCMWIWEEAGQQPLLLSLRPVSCVNQTATLECSPIPADLWELLHETVLLVTVLHLNSKSRFAVNSQASPADDARTLPDDSYRSGFLVFLACQDDLPITPKDTEGSVKPQS